MPPYDWLPAYQIIPAVSPARQSQFAYTGRKIVPEKINFSFFRLHLDFFHFLLHLLLPLCVLGTLFLAGSVLIETLHSLSGSTVVRLYIPSPAPAGRLVEPFDRLFHTTCPPQPPIPER